MSIARTEIPTRIYRIFARESAFRESTAATVAQQAAVRRQISLYVILNVDPRGREAPGRKPNQAGVAYLVPEVGMLRTGGEGGICYVWKPADEMIVWRDPEEVMDSVINRGYIIVVDGSVGGVRSRRRASSFSLFLSVSSLSREEGNERTRLNYTAFKDTE